MLTSKKRERLLQLSTPLAVDAMCKLGLPERVVDPGIRPVIPFSKMAGTAVTVRLESQPDPAKANLDVYHQGFYSGQNASFPVMVIEVPKAHHHQGIFGQGAATMGRRYGFVAALIEGAVRDTEDLKEMNFPVFSRTISPGYICGKVEAVSTGEPVCIGGVTIRAGDVIFGDNDGVVIIKPDELDTVLEKALAIRDWEHKVHALLAKGHTSKEAIDAVGPMP